ncbi:MAG: hypothetical protein HY926_10860 [Elusimicrobia bacterium]|nr:hypothetical protein [Elusimicrobiota bacterium]
MKIPLSALTCLLLAAPLLAVVDAPAPTIDPKEIEAYKKKVGDSTFNLAERECAKKPAAAQKGCWEEYIRAANAKDDKPAQGLKNEQDLSPTLNNRPRCSGQWVGGKCVEAGAAPEGTDKGGNKGPGQEAAGADPCKGKKDPKEKAKCLAAEAAKTPAAEGKPKENLTVDCPKDQIRTKDGCVPNKGTPAADAKKPEDPNKWNSTIAGGKMAIWAGFIGLILGGPTGMLLAAMVGFGAGYFIKEMS